MGTARHLCGQWPRARRRACRSSWCASATCAARPPRRLALQQRLGPDSGIRVESAGVRALVGEPVEQRTANVLRANGVDTDGFAARQARAGAPRAGRRRARHDPRACAAPRPAPTRRSCAGCGRCASLARLLGTVEEAQAPVDVSPAERLRAAVEPVRRQPAALRAAVPRRRRGRSVRSRRRRPQGRLAARRPGAAGAAPSGAG
nr:hypothetical protein [Angustibacter aerolatus]